MLLRGARLNQITAALHCSNSTVAKCVNLVRKRWLRDDIRQSRQKRSQRVKQLEQNAQRALASFERSRNDSEKITTTYRRVKCKQCEGSGVGGKGKLCKACEGKGTLTVEDVTKHVQGQAGDAQFLRVFKECIVEAAKIEGTYDASKTPSRLLAAAPKHLHLHGVDLTNASPETILRAKQALADLSESARLGAAPVVLEVQAK